MMNLIYFSNFILKVREIRCVVFVPQVESHGSIQLPLQIPHHDYLNVRINNTKKS